MKLPASKLASLVHQSGAQTDRDTARSADARAEVRRQLARGGHPDGAALAAEVRRQVGVHGGLSDRRSGLHYSGGVVWMKGQ
eukprot:6781900-Prymnesium_polylepis.1